MTSVRTWLARLAIGAAALGAGLVAEAEPPAEAPRADEPALRRFLQARLGSGDPTTRYAFAPARLGGDEQQVVVHVTGRSWCGSGGCVTLVLDLEDGAYRLIGEITVTRPPIRMLRTASHGWQDLGVWVQGGGIQPGHEAALPFDGHAYPGNPSVPPAREVRRGARGDVLIPASAAGRLLFESSAP